MMRVTKKLYALLIAGMMAVSLAGCQSTGNSSNGNNAQSEQSSKGSTNSSTKSVSISTGNTFFKPLSANC